MRIRKHKKNVLGQGRAKILPKYHTSSYLASIRSPTENKVCSNARDMVALAVGGVKGRNWEVVGHLFVDPTEVSSVQVTPELIEIQMLPPSTTAASFVPSAEDVIDVQVFLDPVAMFLTMRTDVTIKNRRSDEWYIFKSRCCLDKQVD